MDAKYLRITINDNDFSSSLEKVANMLKNIFLYENKFPTENELEELKYTIKLMWYSIHETTNIMRWKDTSVNHKFSKDDKYIEYFTPNLKIVDYLDIPDWENYEVAYVPLFKDGDVIMV